MVRSPGRLLAIACALVVVAGAGRYCGTALVVERRLEHPDAILSLASHEWERLPAAARLAARYPGARVVITVPPVISEVNCHDCGRRLVRLVRMGVDPNQLDALELTVSGTYGEALAARTFARDTGVRTLLIVTSPYHTRRALATFRKVFAGQGVDIGVYPASADSEADPQRWWRTAYDRWYVRYEWFATAYYVLRYGIAPFASVSP